jgi:biopolymer transport protein ExbD/biopolymer transport protein TolR
MAGNGEKGKHKKWVVHSHEATRPEAGEAKSDINITPLIDVMLVLLIIFMVVTPLAQKGLDIALPQPPPPGTPPQDTQSNQVVLSVDDSASGPVISVNKTPITTLEELDQRLRDIYQTKSDKTLFVRASGKVLYGKVVEAMDVARGAGVERIGIISEKMIEEAGGAVEEGGGAQQ